MKRLLVLVALVLASSVASAATPTATATPTPSPTPVATTVVSMALTTAQHTLLQTSIIPRANQALCRKFNLPTSCVSADLIAAGCVPKACQTTTKQDTTYQSCTIFTQDAAGEALYQADRLCQDHITQFLTNVGADYVSSCLAFNSGTTTFKNTVCSDLGQSAGCAAYPVICQ